MSKPRFIYLLSIVLLAGVLLAALSIGKANKSEPADTTKNQPIKAADAEPVAEYEVEAVPMERDPVREDIPLDADVQRQLWQVCEETGIRYEFALAVIWQETDFRNIIGDGGESFGYMQVQPQWHSARMERYGVTDLMDPYGNFLVGCDYLAELAETGQRIEWILHAYNGGPAYANDMAKAGEVSQYAKAVLNYMNILDTEEF